MNHKIDMNELLDKSWNSNIRYCIKFDYTKPL